MRLDTNAGKPAVLHTAGFRDSGPGQSTSTGNHSTAVRTGTPIATLPLRDYPHEAIDAIDAAHARRPPVALMLVLPLVLPLVRASNPPEDIACVPYERGTGELLNPRVAWRKCAASDKLISLLRRRRVAVQPGLTAGEASDLITASSARTAVAG